MAYTLSYDKEWLKPPVAKKAKQALPKTSSAQQAYIRTLGFKPKDMPEFRSDMPKPKGVMKVFDILDRPRAGLFNVLQKNTLDFKRDAARNGMGSATVKSAMKSLNPAYNLGSNLPALKEGLVGNTNVTGRSLISSVADDPRVQRNLSANQKRIVNNNVLRSAGGLALEIGGDPTNALPIEVALKPIKGISKAVGLTDNALLPASKALKSSHAYKGIVKTLGGGRDAKHLANIHKADTVAAMGAEIANFTKKATEGVISKGDKVKLVANVTGTVGMLTDEKNAIKVADKVSKAFDRSQAGMAKLKAMGVELDQKRLYEEMVGASTKVAKTAVDKIYKDIASLGRTLQDDVVTDLIAKTGKVSKEVLEKNRGEYLRGLYQAQDPGEYIKQIAQPRQGSHAFGAEVGLTKMKINDSLRVIEYIKANPDKFPKGVTQQVMKISDDIRLANPGKGVDRVRKELARALQFDDADSYIKSVRGNLVSDKRLPGRLFDVGKITSKDIAAFTGKSVKNMGIAEELTRLRKLRDYAGMEQFLISRVFKSPDELYNALSKRGYTQMKPYTLKLKEGKYIKILKNKDSFKGLSQLSEDVLRENWEKTRLDVGIAEIEKEIKRRAGSKKLADMNMAADSFTGLLKNRLGEENFKKFALEGRRAVGLVDEANLVLPESIEQGIRFASTDMMLKKTAEFAMDFPSESVAKAADFRLIPNTAKYGDLAGKYVPDVVFDDIVGLTEPGGGMMRQALNNWKKLKLFSPLNFAPNARNMIGDMTANSLVEGGPSVIRQIALMPKAIDDYWKGGRYTKLLTEKGVFASKYASQEGRRQLASAMGKQADGGVMDLVTKATDKFTSKSLNTRIPGVGFGTEAYGYTSDIGKMVQIIHQVEKNGLSIDDAIKMADKATFDYAKLPVSLRKYRDNLMPFMTYKYFATQLVWDTFLNRTGKITKLTQARRAVEGLTADQANEEDLPDYIKNNRAFHIRTPFKDSANNPRYFDLSYVHPMGDLQNMGASDFLLGNPFIKAPFELGFNKNTFTGGKIFNETDTKSEKAATAAKYLISQFGPNAPYWIDQSGRNTILDAARGIPNSQKNKPQLGYELAAKMGGIKLREINPKVQKKNNKYGVSQKEQEIKSRIKKIKNDENMDAEKKRKKIEREKAKLKALKQ